MRLPHCNCHSCHRLEIIVTNQIAYSSNFRYWFKFSFSLSCLCCMNGTFCQIIFAFGSAIAVTNMFDLNNFLRSALRVEINLATISMGWLMSPISVKNSIGNSLYVFSLITPTNFVIYFVKLLSVLSVVVLLLCSCLPWLVGSLTFSLL